MCCVRLLKGTCLGYFLEKPSIQLFSMFPFVPTEREDLPVTNGQRSELRKRLSKVSQERAVLDRRRRASSFQRILGYPVLWVLLFLLTVLSLCMVGWNVFRLLFGIGALPVSIKVGDCCYLTHAISFPLPHPPPSLPLPLLYPSPLPTVIKKKKNHIPLHH